MLKTDAHLHVELAGLDADQLIRYMDQRQIDQCWLLTWEEQDAPIRQLYQNLPPEEVFEAYEKHPDRIIPFYAPDPSTRNLEKTVARHMEKGMKGCGELKVTRRWEDRQMGTYLQTMDQFDLPVLFHMERPRRHYVPRHTGFMEKVLDVLLNGALNGLAKHYLLRFSRQTSILKDHIEDHMKYFPGYLYDFAGLEKRLRQFPELNFIGHGPHFWNHISDDPPQILVHDKGSIDHFGVIDRLLSSYPNMYCDISGKSGFNALSRDREKARVFLEKHHRKILYGTDNTGLDYDALIDSFHLPEEKLRNIYYLNAGRLVND